MPPNEKPKQKKSKGPKSRTSKAGPYWEHFTDTNKDDFGTKKLKYLKMGIENHSYYEPVRKEKDILFEKPKKQQKAKTL